MLVEMKAMAGSPACATYIAKLVTTAALSDVSYERHIRLKDY